MFVSRSASAQLSDQDYYAERCPKALETIKSAVKSAVTNESRMGASLLRLHFHDCFVNARGFDVIDTIKSEVEKLCPGVVSCADILAIVARDSVVELGGRSWQVQLGRRDSTTASLNAANTDLPAPTLNLSALITSFSNKGLTAKEMVTLSGSHTIGQARCVTFRARLYNENDISSSFATSLKANCPSSGGDSNLSPLDVTSPTLFDNAYYSNLVSQKGLLHSDQQLFSGGSTNAQVTAYSENMGSFKDDFAKAMVKMGGLSPLTESTGQIRTNCRRVN
ncbi:hypothetical protein NL676_001207 [Syzygium grande]|nr:hypothetical protein NL676_001207 [Syzygium grande]